LIGSIPFGYLTVRFKTGQDIRQVQSGRTGGTNAMRAAGSRAGLLTAGLDMFKAASTVAISRFFYPEAYWLHILAPIFAILGHNLSIFLVRRDTEGRLRLGGGAGGAPCVGGSFGLWPPSFLIIVPLAGAIYFGIGYASVTTLSVGVLSTLIFLYRAWAGTSPWTYAIYGLLAEILLILALLPNIRRLVQGNERLVGWRAKRAKAQTESSTNVQDS
jgi:glycerol-3-phosphate acyltransferase PlsY